MNIMFWPSWAFMAAAAFRMPASLMVILSRIRRILFRMTLPCITGSISGLFE